MKHLRLPILLFALALVASCEGIVRTSGGAAAGPDEPDAGVADVSGPDAGGDAARDALDAAADLPSPPPDGCVPTCEGRACGDDGCGGLCGPCGQGQTCDLEGRCVSDYPAGPYGTEPGQVLPPDLTFFSRDGDPVDVRTLRAQGSVMLLVSSAGWCSVCKEEAPEINEFWVDAAEQGFVLVYTLYEDQFGRPITPGFVDAWVEELELDYPVFQDKDFALSPYYPDSDATPLNMVVTTADMQIRFVQAGSGQEALREASRYLGR